MEIFKEFLRLENEIFLEHPSFKDFIPDIFEKDLKDIQDKYTLFKTSTNLNSLINIFKSLDENLRKDERTKPKLKKQRLTNLIKFMYFILSEENDNEDPKDSVCILVANVLMAYLNFTSECELAEKSDKTTVFLLTLNRLTKRFNEGHKFPQELLYNFIEFVSKLKTTYQTTKSTIQFLHLFASTYYNMITSLTIYDKQCALGFLAFVSLLKILTNKHNDFTMRRQIIHFLILNFEVTYSEITDLTSVQKGTVHSNFILLFRQAKDYFKKDPDAIIYTIIVLAKVCPDSKTLAMIGNQLEFESFKKFVMVLVKIGHREYTKKEFHDNYQKFFYNLLESPYINKESDETVSSTAKEHLKLKGYILEEFLWPLHGKNYEKIEKTVHLYNKVLMLNDVETRIVVKDFLTNHQYYKESHILGVAYEHCAINWNSSCKAMNRYYILLFCNIYKIRETINVDSFKRFSALMNNADIVDLITCIKTLVSVIVKQGFINRGISYVILNILTKNALSPNLEYVHYLKALYEVIFTDNNDMNFGEDTAALIQTLDLDLSALVDRMIIQNYINQGTIEYLCRRIYISKHIWLLFEKVLPKFPNLSIPSDIILYWQNKEPVVFLKDCYCKNFFIVLHKVIEKKNAFDSEESAFLTSFALYLQSEILKRKISLEIIPYALVILRKITDIIQVNYSLFMIFYQELEMKIRDCMKFVSNNNDHSWRPKILPRDISYYSEINQIFGDKSQFNIFQSTITCIKDGLKVMKQHYKKYPELFDCILKCISQLCTRSQDLVTDTIENLKFVLIDGKPKSQLNALCCLYDIAVTRTGNYDIVLENIFKIMSYDPDYIKETTSRLIFQLIKDDRIIPDQYQMYSIVYNFAKTCFKRHYNCFKETFLYPHYEKLMEKNFIYILLFFNKYYNHPKYSVSESDLEKVDKYLIPFNKRHIIYEYMFLILPLKNSKMILTNIYSEIVQNFFSLNIGYPQSYELLQDIISITFNLLKTEHISDYPRNEEIYKETIKNTLEIIKGPARKAENVSKKIDENDVYTKQILTELLKIFNKFEDERGKYVAADLFHTILAFFEFNKNNLQNIVNEDGYKTNFTNSIYKGVKFYEANLGLFHFDEYGSMSPENEMVCDLNGFKRK